MPVTLTIGPHIYGRLNSVFYVKVKTFHLMLLPPEVTINSTRIKLPPEKVMFFTLRLSKTEAGRKRIRNILFCFCKHAKLNSCTCRDIQLDESVFMDDDETHSYRCHLWTAGLLKSFVAFLSGTPIGETINRQTELRVWQIEGTHFDDSRPFKILGTVLKHLYL